MSYANYKIITKYLQMSINQNNKQSKTTMFNSKNNIFSKINQPQIGNNRL